MKQCVHIAYRTMGTDCLQTVELIKPKRGVVLVDWQGSGWYRLLPESEAVKTSVRHVCGETAELQGIQVNINLPDVQILKNDKEGEAALKLGVLSPMKFTDFFSHKGKAFPSSEALEALARALAAIPNPNAVISSPASDTSSSSTAANAGHVVPAHLLAQFNAAANAAPVPVAAGEAHGQQVGAENEADMQEVAIPPPPPPAEMAGAPERLEG
mmetsp:Transcript_15844/g.28903  ORF Transcript_15844/g.28903 Transcript_15844/m.28903 type:complete len:213 (-) Transcript_15844:99-737(-)